MKEVYCEEVIISFFETRGNGQKHSPFRRIKQVFTKSGELIAEYDSSPETFTYTEMMQFSMWCKNKELKSVGITDVHNWIDEIQDK